MGSTENEAGEGMPRAKDGKKDKKERKKQKREKGSVDTEESAQIDGKEVVNGREVVEENKAGEGMARANGGKKDEKKRKKQKRQKDSGDTEEVSAQIDGKEVVNGRDVLEENEAREGMARAKDGKKDEKMRKKQKRQKGSGDKEEVSAQIGGEEVVDEREVLEENFMEKVSKNGGSMDSTENEAGEGMPRSKDEKKRKKRKREKDEVISGGIDGKEDRNEKEILEENIQENVEPSRKKKQKTDLGNGERKDHIAAANYSNEFEEKKKKKKKKKKKVEPEKPSPKDASKRVSFSEDVQIFPSSDDPNEEGSAQKAELVRGKRFSPEEDEMVKEAVLNYIDTHELGEEGLEKVLKCKNYPEARNCWKEIGEALPWRPCGSVYHRAHILFEKDENSKWTKEELELLRKFHEKHGPDWRTLGDALGKHRLHVKDAWRRINVANKKSGQWSQEEYQNLFDLVNMDLRMKAFEERKSKHGMLRDNICWTAISSKLGTRATHICCTKWYHNLASPMVTEGEWLEVDDYHLVIALYERDECCMEDVDWDSLLEHRPGDVCRKRWNQMVKHLGELKNGSFADQVEVLMNRYCPDVLEARETYYSKPVVD